MLQQHVEQNADVTVGCIEVPRAEATGFGVMDVDEQDVIRSFVEKPADPPAMPGKPDVSLASMGIYVFETRFPDRPAPARRGGLPARPTTSARTSFPTSSSNGRAVAHSFQRSCVRSEAESGSYWRDVGTVDAYWSANIDLTAVVPDLDIYDQDWPIWTYNEITPPAKFVHDEDGRRGHRDFIAGVRRLHRFGLAVRRTLLSTGARVNSYRDVENAVILPRVECRPLGAAQECRHRRRCANPRGAGRRRGPGTGRQEIPQNGEGHLPDYATDDRQADLMAFLLSCGSLTAPERERSGGSGMIARTPGATPHPAPLRARWRGEVRLR